MYFRRIFRRESSAYNASPPPISGFISSYNTTSTLRDIWSARHLINQLIWRDFTVRYRQTLLGWLWALLSPALNMILYYFFFGILVRFSTPDYQAPYALVLLCGLVPWMLFTATMNAACECLVNNLHLIKKIWFPRISLAIAATGISYIDFVLALMCLGMLIPICGYNWSPIGLPILLLSGVQISICGWGIGCILAVARMRFRDIRHLIPMITQAAFYVTPVVWTPGVLPERWQWLTTLNPLANVLAIYRYVLLNGPVPTTMEILISIIQSVVIGIVGYIFFVYFEPEATERE